MESSHSLLTDQQYRNLQSLAEMTHIHVERSNGLLADLPIDPATYPAQIMHHVVGAPQPREVVDGIAAIAEPIYPIIKQQLGTGSNAEAVKIAGDLLNSGANVMVVTNHANITDIAIAEAGLYSHLKSNEVSFRSAIIISQLVSSIWLDPDQPLIMACDKPRQLSSDADVYDVMRLIATTLNSRVWGKKFVYNES